MVNQRGRPAIGAVLAALLLPGCALFGPSFPHSSSPATKKDPFKDEEISKSFIVPPVQNQKTPFPPPKFPLPEYERSRDLEIAGIESPTTAAPPPLPEPRNVKPTPAEIVIKREPLTEALQCMLDNKHDDALRHLQTYDADTQELFQRLLPAMSLLSKKKLSDLSAAEIAVLHEQLYSLVGTLRPRTALEIGKMCFCEWVKEYGNYKPLPEAYAFAAASPNRLGESVLLYVELRNFASELRQGAYETRLSSSIEICDSRGEMVWTNGFDDRPVRRRTQLHDLHNPYSFHVPKGMPPGTYRLTIQVTDVTLPGSQRTARQSIEFRVTPPVLRASLK
jgi:hypothetical protein